MLPQPHDPVDRAGGQQPLDKEKELRVPRTGVARRRPAGREGFFNQPGDVVGMPGNPVCPPIRRAKIFDERRIGPGVLDHRR